MIMNKSSGEDISWILVLIERVNTPWITPRELCPTGDMAVRGLAENV
jgi:hypothetical protein